MEGALVSGATGPIGRALVRAFARAGHFVGIGWRRDEASARAALEDARREGGDGILLEGDLADPAAAERVVRGFLAATPSLDVLVNNAGFADDRLFLFVEPDVWQRTISSSLGAAYALTRAALRSMIARRQGAIVSVSSVSALAGLAGQVHYAAAKSGLHGFTRALAREVGRYGIRVNAVAPGPIESPAIERLPEERRRFLLEATCLGRAGTPEEVARVVLFLSSSAASYVTGQVLAVDGGIAGGS